jgi:hypothetical protein
MLSLLGFLLQFPSRPAPSHWPWALFVAGVVVGLALLYRRAYRGGAGTVSTGLRDAQKAGSVYVLTNPGHEHLVKIGYTTRDAATRAKELSSATGVPGDFEVAYETRSQNPQAVEQAVHKRLANHKVTRNREFFEVTPAEARRAIDAVRGAGASLSRRGLGAVLLALGLCASVALVSYHPADNAGAQLDAALETVMRLDAAPTDEAPHNLLGLPGAWLARLLIPEGLGSFALVPSGLVALVGLALARGQSVRPLLGPTLLVLLATGAAATLVGWAGHALQSPPVGWAGYGHPPSRMLPWTGAAGLYLAAWLRAALGPTGSLLLLGATIGGCGIILNWWGRRPTTR